jgi:Bacterial regulatory helix-turn-helix protein, lysR family
LGKSAEQSLCNIFVPGRVVWDELRVAGPKQVWRHKVAEMHRRYEGINIRIEIVRAPVAIADLGSYSRAGAKLGLSQPAITAQVK